MRAASMLMTFAVLDGVMVAAGALAPEGTANTEALRRPLLAILVITGVGLVALAALSWTGRWLARLRGDASRAIGGLLVGGAYAAAMLGCLAWAALWFSPIHALVALAGVACAALLLFQLWAGDELQRQAPFNS